MAPKKNTSTSKGRTVGIEISPGKKAEFPIGPNEGILISNCPELTELPAGIECRALIIKNCANLRHISGDLRVRRLDLSGCTGLTELPSQLNCYDLNLENTRLRRLPADLRVENRLDLTDNTELEALPSGLETGALILRGCTNLRSLPEGLSVDFLDLVGCTNLRGWPARGRLRNGRLNMRGCVNLSNLPPWLETISQLDVSGCPKITSLPETLHVRSWIDIAGTRIQGLPKQLGGVMLRWRGVIIDERIAFRPETITVDEILAEDNAERRRVLLDRFGFARFMQEAHAEVLDTDRDKGGERRLLKIDLKNDEALVCVSFICPSTSRQYLTRVPPEMTTCHQAVAWMAGFDDPSKYKPLAET